MKKLITEYITECETQNITEWIEDLKRALQQVIY